MGYMAAGCVNLPNPCLKWTVDLGRIAMMMTWVSYENWELFFLEPYVPGSKLPLFPYNRGWETQPNSRGLYTHYKDFVIKGGRSPIPNDFLITKPSLVTPEGVLAQHCVAFDTNRVGVVNVRGNKISCEPQGKTRWCIIRNTNLYYLQ